MYMYTCKRLHVHCMLYSMCTVHVHVHATNECTSCTCTCTCHYRNV